MSQRFWNIVLTLLHVVSSLCAGFCFIFSVVTWTYGSRCLPRLVDHFGDPIKFVNGLPVVCETVVYGLGFVCFLNAMMAMGLHCWRKTTGILIFHLTLVAIFIAFSVLSGSTFTIHYLLWCDSVAQKMPSNSVRCDEATSRFDKFHKTDNMTTFRSQLEIQQISVWAMVPLTFITVLVYAVSLKNLLLEKTDTTEPSPTTSNVAGRRDRNIHFISVRDNGRTSSTFGNEEREPLVGRTNLGSDVMGDVRPRTPPTAPHNGYNSQHYPLPTHSKGNPFDNNY